MTSIEAPERSVSRFAHSHTSRYILSPCAATDLCKAILRMPTECGRCRYSILAPVQYSQLRSNRSPSSPSNTWNRQKGILLLCKISSERQGCLLDGKYNDILFNVVADRRPGTHNTDGINSAIPFTLDWQHPWANPVAILSWFSERPCYY